MATASSFGRTLFTLGGSIGLHAAIVGVGLAVLLSRRPPTDAHALEAPAPSASTRDDWAGETAELPGQQSPAVYDVDTEAVAAPPPSPPAAEVAEVAAPKTPDPVAEAPRPKKPKPRKKKPVDGETADATAKAAGASDARGEGDGKGNGSFGVEGESKTRDLGRAFVRAIPPACQGDPAWAKLPPGDGGKIEIEIHVDAEGKITGFDPVSKDPPKQLVQLAKRTIALLGAGTFAVRPGAVSEGTELLKIKATLSDVSASGSESGGPESLAYSPFENGKGKATFTQSNGRRVEVEVEVAKTKK